MAAKLIVELTLGEETGASIVDRLPPVGAPEAGANFLGNLLLACAAGVTRGKVAVGVADAVGVRASATITCVVASITAGDTLVLDDDLIFTAVSGAATAASAQYSKDTSNTACGISLAAAINAYPPSKARFIATESSGTVTVTARVYGDVGNLVKIRKFVTNGAAHVLSGATLSGGKEPTALVTSVITCVVANTDADDTIRIGKTTFTAKSSGASGQGEFNLGASNTAMGDNLLAKIVAHDDLAGLVTGVNASGVITLTWTCPPRLAVHAGYMVSSDADGLAVTTQPTTTVAHTNVQAPITYALGAA